ncbi:2-oxoglutarate dehydrogenase complex dihydrolipoyllysine-residue succinyltransferase [Pacificimonas flava]|uniref:Dihydrolipoyllysine-residue succinyltransferase component of 2-oxoglutarate dehydrogenase complex n=1 Tax=Pacificimonas flava TaxID=1234595 RepID=M2SBJ2_9SPHN|nr:2-oxoglutarate dehydrogenase complex dihydrolipoyllysine-residue succinyltransferase [Pacificimonas flava]EMD82740.1 Dihydrolipoamide succinyltransferase component (E2) [Pacificimonas flava]MBB5279359.1 2-oxoglutarate dehydrogenase E2 component (dihydrolipoamide succinyltransferase) [Pacificimonas flava]
MPTDVVVPTLGESITEATVGEWLKQPGDSVEADEIIASLETDKVAVEVPAPTAGVLGEILAQEGDDVEVGAVLARIEAGGEGAAKTAAPKADKAEAAEDEDGSAEAEDSADEAAGGDDSASDALSPAVKKLLAEHDLDPSSIKGTGKGGRLLKEDVKRAVSGGAAKKSAGGAGETKTKIEDTAPAGAVDSRPLTKAAAGAGRNEERKRMTRLRQTIAKRLKEAQNTAAMLTTFNDVDMSAVMKARDQYKDMFEKKHGVRLGFMSFFTKACALALKDVPAVNASIEGDEIVYRDYADIGIAVSSPGGLVVPILKDADKLSFADTEKAIGDFGRRARDGELKLEELQGGTFTISNGGVFGSLLSTPILNPPQSGVLGMHRIEERPVVVDGEIVIRPMMYLALSYDHRIVDGREAVTFLVRVKEAIEDPTRLVLDL